MSGGIAESLLMEILLESIRDSRRPEIRYRISPLYQGYLGFDLPKRRQRKASQMRWSASSPHGRNARLEVFGLLMVSFSENDFFREKHVPELGKQ